MNVRIPRIPRWYLPFAAMLFEDLRPGPDPLAGIDIEREYELIRQKKSTLSQAKRDMVVRRWEQIHKEDK